MTSLDEQLQQRRANLDELVKLGVDVYPRRFDRTHTITALVDAYSGRSHDELEAEHIPTTTSGRILGIRSFGKANFLVLSDGLAKIQIYVRQDAMPAIDFQTFKLLDFGDWIGVSGRLFRTKTNELTIWASSVRFLAKCLVPLPEKWHGLTDVEIALPPALSGSDRQSRLAPGVRDAQPGRGGAARVHDRRAGISKSRRR